jgi:DNA-binding NarL/FixJ family response regulator
VINLIVAEPNSLLRFGIRTVLETRGDIVICAEAVDAGSLRSKFLALHHDVLLIGLGLLTHIGAAVLQDWRRERPESRILVHSYEIDPRFAVEAFRFGVVGYLSSDCSASELGNAVSTVAAGRPYITPSLGAAVAAYACFRAGNRSYVSLSAREAKIFQMLSIGMGVKGIARQLDQSECAIDASKLRIMAKMALPDPSELVRHAISQTWQGKHRELHEDCPVWSSGTPTRSAS